MSERHKADDRRDEIVRAARDLCEERGLSQTTIKDIADRVGVTRSLFYHYFPDKESVLDAGLDDIVEDFLGSLDEWNRLREPGNVDRSLQDLLSLFRKRIFETSSFRRSLVSKENASLYTRFVYRVADGSAKFLVDNTVRDLRRYHNVEIDHPYETFYVLVSGMISYMRSHPNAEVDVLKSIVSRALLIDRFVPNMTSLDVEGAF